MKTKKLTEAAMLSAIFVITSIIAIYTGIAYTIYLDIVVPIFIVLIYLRLGFKYTVLSAVTTLFIVMFSIGDIISAIWMTQGILMGLICGYFIPKEGTILDDFFYSAILGCFVMILIDVYFSKLTGYSFIREFNGYAVMFPLGEELLKTVFYIFVATIPIGTVLLVYFVGLFLGKRLNILNNFSNEKYKIIINYKKYGSYLCCTEKTFYSALLYLIVMEVLMHTKFLEGPTYIVTVTMAVRVVAIYFVLKDSFSFVSKWIYMKINSKLIAQLICFLIVYLLLLDFKVSTSIIIISGILLNLIFNLRQQQIIILNKNLRINGN